MTNNGQGSPAEGTTTGESPQWVIDATNEFGIRTYVVVDHGIEQRYAHEDQLPDWAVKALGREFLDDFAHTDGIWTWGLQGRTKEDSVLAAMAADNLQAWQSAKRQAPGDSDVLRNLRSTWRAPLEQRAKLVADTATYAVRLLDSLQREIAARSAVVQALTSQAEAARAQANHAEQVARLSEEQAAAVNAFLDRLLQARLEAMERQARSREWILATVVALIIGIAAILVSHYLVGF